MRYQQNDENSTSINQSPERVT